MAAKTRTVTARRDYPLSAEALAGLSPAEDQYIDAAQENEDTEVMNDHASLLDNQAESITSHTSLLDNHAESITGISETVEENARPKSESMTFTLGTP